MGVNLQSVSLQPTACCADWSSFLIATGKTSCLLHQTSSDYWRLDSDNIRVQTTRQARGLESRASLLKSIYLLSGGGGEEPTDVKMPLGLEPWTWTHPPVLPHCKRYHDITLCVGGRAWCGVVKQTQLINLTILTDLTVLPLKA